MTGSDGTIIIDRRTIGDGRGVMTGMECALDGTTIRLSGADGSTVSLLLPDVTPDGSMPLLVSDGDRGDPGVPSWMDDDAVHTELCWCGLTGGFTIKAFDHGMPAELHFSGGWRFYLWEGSAGTIGGNAIDMRLNTDTQQYVVETMSVADLNAAAFDGAGRTLRIRSVAGGDGMLFRQGGLTIGFPTRPGRHTLEVHTRPSGACGLPGVFCGRLVGDEIRVVPPDNGPEATDPMPGFTGKWDVWTRDDGLAMEPAGEDSRLLEP